MEGSFAWAWKAIQLVLALLYLVFDELGGFARWLKARFQPLAWYFALVQQLAQVMEKKGIRSQNGNVRLITPFLTLPFLLVPVSLILPAKIILLGLIIQHPILAVAALVLAKFLGAVFVKETWNILRPVARRDRRIAWADDRWLALERWARDTVRGFADAVRRSNAYKAVTDLGRALRASLRP